MQYLLGVLYLALLGELLFLLIQPINRLSYNVVMLGSVVLLGIWTAYLLRRRKRLLAVLLVPPGLLLLTLVNQQAVDRAHLRELYLAELRTFAGTEYVWGGENCLGIDCSGLPRKSLINALARYGLTHANGRALLQSGWYWWHDASALELLSGYRGETQVEPTVFTINSQNPRVRPGDLAVTQNGVHVMVFLDAHTVIQADPGPGRVVIDTIPNDKHWYTERVQLVRWTALSDPVESIRP
jgi:hypothetical protein